MIRRRWDRRSVKLFFFFSSRRRHTRCSRDWSSDVCSSDLKHKRDTEDNWTAVRPRHASQYNAGRGHPRREGADRKSTRLNSSHGYISYAVFCLKKKKVLRLVSAKTVQLQSRIQAATDDLMS